MQVRPHGSSPWPTSSPQFPITLGERQTPCQFPPATAWPSPLPTPSLPMAHLAPAKPTRHSPAPGPLHRLCPMPRPLSLISTWLNPCHSNFTQKPPERISLSTPHLFSLAPRLPQWTVRPPHVSPGPAWPLAWGRGRQRAARQQLFECDWAVARPGVLTEPRVLAGHDTPTRMPLATRPPRLQNAVSVQTWVWTAWGHLSRTFYRTARGWFPPPDWFGNSL